MLYLLGWLPAEVPQTADTDSVDDASPVVSQTDGKWLRLGQRIRPRQMPQSPMATLRPALSAPDRGVQQVAGNSLSDGTNGLQPGVGTGVLQVGDRSSSVQQLQTHLRQLGYYNASLDGIFGPLTEEAVRSFQQYQALPVDGIVGPLTWQRLHQGARETTPPSSQPAIANAEATQSVAFSSRAATGSSRGTSAPETFSLLQKPVFTPGLVPHLTFHPLEVTTPQRSPRVLWVTVITLVAVGGVAFYFKADNAPTASKPVGPQPRPKGTAIHRPQPVYPKGYKRIENQQINSPQPVYPGQFQVQPQGKVEGGVGSAAIDPEGTAAVASQTGLPLSQAAVAGVQEKVEAALQQLAQHSPWADQSSATHLPGFIYDLHDSDSRQALEGVVAVLPTEQLSQAASMPPSKSGLFKLLGRLPERHRRTQMPYTYMLLDNIGGCFRLIKNELWLTEAAVCWLNNDEPYTLNIRRIDAAGRSVEKGFTVTINSQQLEMAS